MRIHFFGAARTVTGSNYLLEVNGHKLLLECGLFQGHRDEAFSRNQSFAYDPSQIDAAILSHAHIDHSGNLPNLVKNGFHSPIYATDGTASLADIMLLDAGHIQEYDIAYVNKRRFRHGLPPVEPLYTLEDAAEVKQYFTPVDYDQAFNPVPGVTARLVEAGHILGSAGVVLDIEENGRKLRFWFSGDIGRMDMPLLRDPVLPNGDVDYLMMECTYGDTVHPPIEEAFEQFGEVVLDTINRGGKVIVPSFAVGRTQELVYSLHQMQRNGRLPHIPVYVDSPMAVKTTEVFQQFSRYFDEETREFVANGTHPALAFPHLNYVSSVDESKALNNRREPMIIISASGMAETGRILHHLKNNIEDARNTIVIVSYQAPDTLGRRLVEQAPVVKIFGENYYRRAKVVEIHGFSAHAGQDLLVRYAQAANGHLKGVVLVHGEAKPAAALQAKFTEAGVTPPVSYPDQGQVLEF